jgi:hypothetical protein
MAMPWFSDNGVSMPSRQLSCTDAKSASIRGLANAAEII